MELSFLTSLNKPLKSPLMVTLCALLLTSCATSPTGKTYVKIFPDSQMSQMGAAAFTSMKQSQQVDTSSRNNNYVRCITDAIIKELPPKLANQSWEVNVFKEDSPNAFALPGGKIGVHTGMFKVATNQSQLAAVIGHEIGHVWAQHGNARMSNQFLSSTALQLGAVLAGEPTAQKQQILGVLGIATQVGGLKFSRGHESESDEIGIELMARAGFDPRESVTLWQNMSKLGGAKQPEFLSTHPSNANRIKDLNSKMTRAMGVYQQAQSQGKRPACRL